MISKSRSRFVRIVVVILVDGIDTLCSEHFCGLLETRGSSRRRDGLPSHVGGAGECYNLRAPDPLVFDLVFGRLYADHHPSRPSTEFEPVRLRSGTEREGGRSQGAFKVATRSS